MLAKAQACPCADPGGKGGPYTPLEIGFLRNTGTKPPREAIGPNGSNCFSREVPM